MREIEKNEQQIDNPVISENNESLREAESKKAQFGNSLDSFSSTGDAKNETSVVPEENKENKTDAPKVDETKSENLSPEEKKDSFGSKLDNLSSSGSETETADAYTTAMNNMYDYMNSHNYGREDYAEYSQDPEWQKLNADLQRSMGMEVTSEPAESQVSSSDELSDETTYRNAMNNMSDYLNSHNYGREDYAEYSQDPEWQKLNADLQRSMGMEVTTETPETNPSPEESDSIEIIDASDIDMTYAQGMDSDYFWNHHGNTKEDYMAIAEKIPDVYQALADGKTLDEIKQDPSLRDTVHAYFDANNIIKVEQRDGSYSFADDGRHRIAAAQELGYRIPVEVDRIDGE